MRSYETARSLFGFLEFVAWSMVVVGGLVAIGWAGATSGFMRGGTVLLMAMPGVIIAIFGLFLVALIQTARASVDTAELTQQMLKVARDQLAVSSQSMKDQSAPPRTYQARDVAEDLAPRATFNAQELSAKDVAPEQSDFIFRRQVVQFRDGFYLYRGETFISAEDAKAHILARIEGVDTPREMDPVEDALETEKLQAPVPPEPALAEPSPVEPEPVEPEPTKLAPAEPIFQVPHVITEEGGKYYSAGMAFSSLESAQRYIDQLGVNPNAKLNGVTRKS